MEVSLLTTTLAGVFIALAGMTASVVMFLRVPGLNKAIQIPGMPRIWFLSLITLKLWIATFLGYVSIGTIVGGLPVEARRIINVVIAVLAATQAVSVCIAIWRDQRKTHAGHWEPGRWIAGRRGGLEED